MTDWMPNRLTNRPPCWYGERTCQAAAVGSVDGEGFVEASEAALAAAPVIGVAMLASPALLAFPVILDKLLMLDVAVAPRVCGGRQTQRLRQNKWTVYGVAVDAGPC